MIYFYAGLGAAMLTGIMVLFEVGLALTGKSLFGELPYADSRLDLVNSADQLFQRMLTQQPDLQAVGTGRYELDLCQQLLCRIQGLGCRYGNTKSPFYTSLQGYSTPSANPPSGVWISSCALERKLDQSGYTHRLLIRPNRESLNLGYELYSCIVKQTSVDQRCLFERGA